VQNLLVLDSLVLTSILELSAYDVKVLRFVLTGHEDSGLRTITQWLGW
jgi:hypothetical protein